MSALSKKSARDDSDVTGPRLFVHDPSLPEKVRLEKASKLKGPMVDRDVRREMFQLGSHSGAGSNTLQEGVS